MPSREYIKYIVIEKRVYIWKENKGLLNLKQASANFLIIQSAYMTKNYLAPRWQVIFFWSISKNNFKVG